MFSQAVIYYPDNGAMLKKIHKAIAAQHCIASTKYMDTLDLTIEQKSALLDAVISSYSENE